MFKGHGKSRSFTGNIAFTPQDSLTILAMWIWIVNKIYIFLIKFHLSWFSVSTIPLAWINKAICLLMRVTCWLSGASRSLVLQRNWTARTPGGSASTVFGLLNVALIEQFITPDHCQLSGQEKTKKAMKMPRISWQAQQAGRDQHLSPRQQSRCDFIWSNDFVCRKWQIDAFVSGGLVNGGNE